jgi:outer membrane protein insertion porin family
MQRIFTRFCLLLTVVLTSIISANAQVDTTTKPTSVDPSLLAWKDLNRPKQFNITSIKVTGVFFLDTAIVASISGLQVGDKILHPGGDEFPKAIQNLWKQKLFSNVEIYVTKVAGDDIDIEIHVMERPRLGNYKFKGIKKTEEEELVGKIGLAKQTIVTENTRRTADEVIKKYFGEKGYLNLKLKITETPDTSFVNSIFMLFEIDKGQKVKVNNINFFGNETVSDLKLKKQLKGTKEVSRFTLYPKKDSTLFGVNPRMTFSQYMKDKGFLSISKTKNFLDPWFRFKLLSSAKFNEKKFDEDKEKVIEYYNSIGYRDAIIEEARPYPVSKNNINIDFKVSEGHKYYFGNITWKGNAKYGDSVLNVILGIRKGDVYNIETLNQRLGKQLTPEGGDISGLYMDDGYLFFRAEAVETAVYSDTIDHEIRIVEGPQARIKDIKISGNDRTKEHVIRRELRTIPGELFSRADLIRSQRELGQLN